MNEINEIYTNNTTNNLDNNIVDSPMRLQAQAPYYYDYYGEQTLANHKTIIENQEKILETSYTISFFIAIALVLSMFRNMWRR